MVTKKGGWTMAMRLLPVRENKSYMNQCLDLYTDSKIEFEAEIGEKEKAR